MKRFINIETVRNDWDWNDRNFPD